MGRQSMMWRNSRNKLDAAIAATRLSSAGEVALDMPIYACIQSNTVGKNINRKPPNYLWLA